MKRTSTYAGAITAITIAAVGLFAIVFAGTESVKRQDHRTEERVLETLGVSPKLYKALQSGEDLVFVHSWETLEGVLVSDRLELVEDLSQAGHNVILWRGDD